MTVIPAYSLIDHGTEKLWAEFKQMVRDLGWISLDNTVLWATPQLASTRCVFAQRDDDGSMLGCCVRNEHEGIAWIGYYMMQPSLRGAGIGSKIWSRTLERIRSKKQAMGLRAVSSMYEKYASGDAPIEISRIKKYLLTVEQMKEFCARYEHPVDRSIALYHELDEDQRLDLLRFDREVTRKDRSEWLGKMLASAETEVAVLLKGTKVSAYAAVSTIGHADSNLFKIAPCFASSVDEFASLVKQLMRWVEKHPPGAKIIISLLTRSVGERELTNTLGVPITDELVTLFNEQIETKMDLDRCFVPNNAHCYFDA
ncbi:hypothetical protein PENTCL1PPCAC_15718 [Pristionchus entomophagus]|uniref:N-acetyltransferase domain-containing protein n=1 Tax=Pristionchus entomophagus TaxID=358040 RepID=A0AAV5TE40_9BILA|nr:hypothetical protein PENTCL1PPCAC_15718 [Pristionchus entomophagus]